MLKSKTQPLIRRHLDLNLKISRLKTTANKDVNIDEFKSRLESGPQLSQFISGSVGSDDKWSDYSGKLRREKGDNERYVRHSHPIPLSHDMRSQSSDYDSRRGSRGRYRSDITITA
jgi:hypothetical protein